jgi:hypothetical protein
MFASLDLKFVARFECVTLNSVRMWQCCVAQVIGRSKCVARFKCHPLNCGKWHCHFGDHRKLSSIILSPTVLARATQLFAIIVTRSGNAVHILVMQIVYHMHCHFSKFCERGRYSKRATYIIVSPEF